MKKIIIAFAAVATLITTSAFAGEREKANPALATFQKEFTGATNVKWTEGKDVISASFILSDSRIIAYFNSDGELLGTARNVLFNQLPLAVVKEINNRYGNAPISDIIEYTSGLATYYGMYVDTATKQLKIKITSEGDVTVEKKTKPSK